LTSTTKDDFKKLFLFASIIKHKVLIGKCNIMLHSTIYEIIRTYALNEEGNNQAG